MKKNLFLSTLLSLTAITVPGLAAEPSAADTTQLTYPDVAAEHWAFEALETLAQVYGLKLGYPDGSFKGQQSVSRYELAALILRLMQKMPANATQNPDLDKLQAAFQTEIEALKNEQAETLEGIYDRLDLIEVQAMEREASLLEQFQQQLPFKLSGDLAFRYEHLTANWANPEATVSSTPQSRMTLSLDSLDNDQPFLYGARLNMGGMRNPTNPWWRLGDFGARVDFTLDRFFLTWRPSDFFDVTIGKFQNLYSNSELFMDLDVQPEGAMQRLHFKDITPFWSSASLLLGQSIFNMNSLYQGHTFLLSAKGDSRFNFEPLHLDLSAAYHHYVGEAVFYNANRIANENDQLPRVVGNAMHNTPGTQFAIANLFAGLTWDITPDLPLKLSGDYLRNIQAQSLNQALQGSLSLGGLRKAGDWQLGYFFKYLEADASVSYFVEDQLLGTDVMAHEGQAAVKLWDQTTLFATYQVATRLSAELDNPRHTLRVGVHQRF